MTSSSPSTSEEEEARKKIETRPPTRRRKPMGVPPMLKEELRMSIIARRRARGEGQLEIEFNEPEQMELTPAEQEKKERRREQNRRAAQRCRNKKRLSQYNVIQNFERVVEQNQDLRSQVEVLRRERDDLKKTLNDHRRSCPSLAKVKVEPSEAMNTTDMNMTDVLVNSSQMQTSQETPVKCHIPSSDSFSPYGGHQSLGDVALVVPPLAVSSYNQLSVQVHPQPQDDHLHHYQPQPQPSDIPHYHAWRYSPTQCAAKPRSTSCMFSTSTPKVARISEPEHPPHLHPHPSHNQQQQQHHSEPAAYFDERQQDCFHPFSETPQAPVLTSSTSTFQQSGARNTQYPDLCRLLQSQPSPCQVVPTLNSPCPSSDTRKRSCSQGLTRQRSLSGGSTSGMDVSQPGTESVRFSSVSSESSACSDSQTTIYQELRTVEVPDIDNDDVFSGVANVPFPGHDINNNISVGSVSGSDDNNNERSNQIPSVTQRRLGGPAGSLTPIGPQAYRSVVANTRPDSGSSFSSNSSNTSNGSTTNISNNSSSSSSNSSIIPGVDDVSDLLLQISSDDLLFFSPTEETESSGDILSYYMNCTPED